MHPPPASIPSPELSYPAPCCLSMSTLLIGAGDHLRAEAFPPEENLNKAYMLNKRKTRSLPYRMIARVCLVFK